MGNFLVIWAPLLPLSALTGMVALGILVLALGMLAPRLGRPAPGLVLRAIALSGILIALTNPSLILEDREVLSDIGLVIVDRSQSQSIGDRMTQTERALTELRAWAATEDNLELRVIDAPQVSGDKARPIVDPSDGTYLFTALEHALADIPRERFAGAVLITDGLIHDAPADVTNLNLTGPIHALMTGVRDQGDRRLAIVQSPGFGIVGDEVRLTLHVDEPHAVQARQAQITIRRNGEARGRTALVPVGVDHAIDIVVDRGGPSVFEIIVNEGKQELTLANNRAVVTINGIRDRLNVLLISGAPHPGERTWRNLLKADPSVDLVHFTILRPPDKQDGTPVRELSLIAFPYRELFEIKLNDFDLIIFDRYQRMGILPSVYLRNVANYVKSGGALLEATGPEINPTASLYRTALGAVLPGEPTGDLIEGPFTVNVNATGRRHPVTAHLTGLPNEPGAPPNWGRWFRQIDAHLKSGTVVMEGANERPLLILDRVGEGRIGQFLSDHIWLWARGYEGGGPHNELLRRLAHWLMKEPELEEDRLTTFVRGDTIEITRRSLTPDPTSVVVTSPTGEESRIVLEELGNGLAAGQIAVSAPGIYHFDDGTRTAVAGVGTINLIEFADVTATDLPLRPTASATGGGITWLADNGIPDLRHNRAGRAQADTPSGGGSARWLAFQRNNALAVRGVRNVPLLPALLLLIVIGGMLMGAWRLESR